MAKCRSLAAATCLAAVLVGSATAQPVTIPGDIQVAIMACLNAAIDHQRVIRVGRVLKLTCDGSSSRILFERLGGLVDPIAVEWGEIRPFSRTPGVTLNNCARVTQGRDQSLDDQVYCELHLNMGVFSQS